MYETQDESNHNSKCNKKGLTSEGWFDTLVLPKLKVELKLLFGWF